MSNIAKAFADGKAFVPFITCGDPDLDTTAACVVEMMSLMATSLGLSNIYLYGVTSELSKNSEVMRELGIKEGYTPLAALALGYSDDGVNICKEFTSTLEVIRN